MSLVGGRLAACAAGWRQHAALERPLRRRRARRRRRHRHRLRGEPLRHDRHILRAQSLRDRGHAVRCPRATRIEAPRTELCHEIVARAVPRAPARAARCRSAPRHGIRCTPECRAAHRHARTSVSARRASSPDGGALAGAGYATCCAAKCCASSRSIASSRFSKRRAIVTCVRRPSRKFCICARR